MIYERQGILAVSASMLGADFAPSFSASDFGPDLAVVRIHGPLAGSVCSDMDDYESIVERVSMACQTTAPIVVLDIDSPGGDVTGLFEAVEQLRATCAESGKTLVAYVSGQCCSAAYALACAASRIVTCSTGIVGSVGVIDCRMDVTANQEMAGVRYSMVTSGRRKADGHPCVPITDAEMLARQRVVDDLAAVFFALVDSARAASGMRSAELDANVYVGASAASMGLADDVLSWREFLVSVSTSTQEGISIMSYEELIAALTAMAEGDGPDAEKAKAALAAINQTSDESEPADDVQASSEGQEEPAPEADSSAVAQLVAQIEQLSAQVRELNSQREAGEKSALIASRPDLSPALVDLLKEKTLDEAKAIVAALPKRKFGASKTVAPVRGAGQADGTESSPEFDRLDALMGVNVGKSDKVVRTPHSLILGSTRKGA